MRRISGIAVTAAMFASIIGPGPAWAAGTLSYANDTFIYTGTSGNDALEIGTYGYPLGLYTRYFYTAGSLIEIHSSADPFCGQNTVWAVECELPEFPIRVDLGAGDDVVSNSAPDSTPRTLIGGPGNDVLAGSDGDDVLWSGSEDDNFDTGTSTLVGGGGNDQLNGAAGADLLEGGSGNDDIQGQAGNDTILGGDGEDTINAGGGADLVAPGLGDDGSVNGGTGEDTISYRDGRNTGVTVTLETDSAHNDGGIEDGADPSNREQARNFEAVTGGAGDDTLIGTEGSDRLDGSEGSDIIDGGPGEDVIVGGPGHDVADYSSRTEALRIEFSAGGSAAGGGESDGLDLMSRDVLTETEEVWGGAGDDQLSGADTAITLRGNGGADQLLGSSAEDLLEGGDGPDTLDGRGGLDTVSYAGRSEAVVVTLNDGAGGDGGPLDGAAGARDTTIAIENLVGGAGPDVLIGDDAANLLRGGGGDDLLSGLGGIDQFFGEAGADEIHAKDGQSETVDCGTDTDTAVAFDAVDTLVSCEPPQPQQPGGGSPVGGGAPGSGGQPPAGRPVISSLLSVATKAKGTRTLFTRVRLTGLPGGAVVRLSCKARSKRSCPFRVVKKSFASGAAKFDLAPRFRKRALPAKVTIELRVTAPGTIGKVLTLKTRGKRKPERIAGCADESGKRIACP